jgi:hypothetical protein
MADTEFANIRPGDEKSGANTHSNDLTYNGNLAQSTEQDALDMHKLGVRQETKVTVEYMLVCNCYISQLTGFPSGASA